MASLYQNYEDCIDMLRRKYHLTRDEAEEIWHVGDEDGQEVHVKGWRFFSNICYTSSPGDDEYYINVHGPQGEQLFVRYHYTG
jgi:hypothetical protein